ncbi:MAG: 2-oxoacid:acceptor oxidoreductase family protein, partial [Deltaproteobacteria bacterium]|nr:2-oxoacid:acceptor oxidoreductase family protein [Deltaproteobacteria bacterium]
TTYYLSAAPEPIRINCEYHFVDVVLSPDPNVFHHTNALAGLGEHGVFVIQSDRPSPEQVWEDVPPAFQKMILDKKIRFYYLDAFRIAREEATDADLQLRMQGIAFQGAFFAASRVMSEANLDEGQLLEAIRSQLQQKFGAKGARVVEDNLRVVRRGFDELREVVPTEVTTARPAHRRAAEPPIPTMLEALPTSEAPITDVHRFWEQTGSFYARGMGNDNLSDPFIGLGVMPACSALFRDMTQIRFEHPEWDPEKCTACGKCYTVCPDTAIPGLVSEVGPILDTVVRRLRAEGRRLEHLPKAVRQLENHLRSLFAQAAESDPVAGLLEEGIEKTLAASGLEGESAAALREELDLLREELDLFPLALSRPYYTLPEKKQPGSGGLLSITVNPYSCKGCMECVAVCDDDALRPVTQTDDSVKTLRDRWDLWLDLPSTPARYIRVDDLEEGIGALETILLDKEAYLAFTSGDGACLGCSEKTAIHLFIATVEALMQPRVAKHLERLETLIARLERHVQLQLVGELDVGDPEEVSRIVNDFREGDLTLSDLAGRMESNHGSEPIDPEWLERTSRLLAKLKDLRWRYSEGTTGRGRSKLGMLNATGCTSVWGSTWPFNPYPFPWANHLFQDSPSLAMGVFEGHMARMAEGFRAIRQAELEIAGDYRPAEHDEFLTYFDWQQFSDEEWALCPPVVSVGGDGAMYDIGFQNLSRLMASGKPIKVLVVDTQVYSNTGGQACTSGFTGQISDMAPFGRTVQGKQEPRKEIGLIGMAHRTTYVMQSTIAHPSHMIEGFIQGLKARRPALFNLYSSCQPEHGIGDDMSAAQAKLAVESRAYPLFRYDPEAGETPAECFDLEGNPSPREDWPSYQLAYRHGGRDKTLELPMTFADFAITEGRFRKHFRMAPPDTWNERMLPLAEFLELDEDEREGRFPFVWTVDRKQQLTRLLVDRAMVESSEDRRAFWRMLRSFAGVEEKKVSREEIETQVRQEVVGRIASGLMQLAGGDGDANALLEGLAAGSANAAAKGGDSLGEGAPTLTNGMAPWIDSPECTACDDCIDLNPEIFAYGDDGKAYIKDASAGPYSDLVKAAERCTARVIHPGLPRERGSKDIEKWIARGEKYN